MSVLPGETITNFENDPVQRVFEYINGSEIESKLVNLAKIGGVIIDPTLEQPERYATSRLALSPIDLTARETYVAPLMEGAGMTVQEHPFGLIGTLEGKNPDLAPLVIFSHTDTVPKGDMYDGVTGVLGGITVVEAITKAGLTPKRNIHVVALTGEESSAFGFALFGSRGMWHGLSERELDAKIPEGKTIRETLGEEVSEIVRHPIVGEGGTIPTPHAVVELHVEQNDTLEKAGIDLGVVEAIAAPIRYDVKFGNQPLEADLNNPSHSIIFNIKVEGKSDHSGATPMGLHNRADGLSETAKILLAILEQDSELSSVDIGSIKIDGQALNKVPGLTTTEIRLSGESQHDFEERWLALEKILERHNAILEQEVTRFGSVPISVELIDEDSAPQFFKKNEIAARQKAALDFIVDVNQVANLHASESVVGTVGTVSTQNGIISLGLDVRGIDSLSRDKALHTMKTNAGILVHPDSAQFGQELPGSGDPVQLDLTLVDMAKNTIDSLGIGSSMVMNSAAGHDAQNAAKAGHRTVMIFCQSNAGGIAHHPDAYTSPDNLEKGVKALAALTLQLTT